MQRHRPEEGVCLPFILQSSIVNLQSGGIMARPRSEREFAVQVVRALREAGHEALSAGGCVRDEILGLTPKDYDVATSARPEQVQALFPRTVAVGAAFGVIEVLGPRPYSIEVATFRSDGDYSDGR